MLHMRRGNYDKDIMGHLDEEHKDILKGKVSVDPNMMRQTGGTVPLICFQDNIIDDDQQINKYCVYWETFKFMTRDPSCDNPSWTDLRPISVSPKCILHASNESQAWNKAVKIFCEKSPNHLHNNRLFHMPDKDVATKILTTIRPIITKQ